MTIFLRTLASRTQAPAKDGDDLPGADYGDDFEPTGDDADPSGGDDTPDTSAGGDDADEPASELREVVEDPAEAPAAAAPAEHGTAAAPGTEAAASTEAAVEAGLADRVIHEL